MQLATCTAGTVNTDLDNERNSSIVLLTTEELSMEGGCKKLETDMIIRLKLNLLIVKQFAE